MNIKKYALRSSHVALVFSMLWGGYVSGAQQVVTSPYPAVAFMPDIHFHDVYAKFSDNAFEGLPNSISHDNATIRTMYAQLTSTRLFNENYFALRSALDDAAKRNIKIIALPGDFSDDGQSIHIKGLTNILREYQDKYDMRFYATFGNHDPNRPFDRPAGKEDYLGVNGKTQRIYSKGAKECNNYTGLSTIVDAGYELPTVCSEDVKELGQENILHLMSDFGLTPKKSDLYWETPYSAYQYANYTYDQALVASDYNKRLYEICHEGTGGRYKKENYTHCFNVADMSYLVEPSPNLWLLAIDANVYIPKIQSNVNNQKDANNFDGSGDAGYNKMLTHKQQTIDWIKDVMQRAKAQNKTVITFSHFPMIEFDNGASDEIERIFGEGKFQLARSPKEDTSRALAELGIKLHIGGHMHFNDTGVRRYDDNHFLFNILAPSMAAYVPAYKIVSMQDNNQAIIDTIVLNEVDRFNELFEHYQDEWDHLQKIDSKNLWNKEILNAKNYGEFTKGHISELTRLRFIPSEWPCDIRQMLFNLNGRDMLILSQLDTKTPIVNIIALNRSSDMNAVCANNIEVKKVNIESFYQQNSSLAWQEAFEKAQKITQDNGLKLVDFASWNGFDLAVDFYRLRNADELAMKDISDARIKQYYLLTKNLADSLPAYPDQINENSQFEMIFKARFASIFTVLDHFINSNPSIHFMLDLNNGTIKDLQKP